MLNVRKRDGEYEPWSLDKLINSIAKAGVDIKNAEDIATKVESEVKNGLVTNYVDSADIKVVVIKYLKNSFPLEAESYETYTKA